METSHFSFFFFGEGERNRVRGGGLFSAPRKPTYLRWPEVHFDLFVGWFLTLAPAENHTTGNHTTGNRATGNRRTENRTTGNRMTGNPTIGNHMTGNSVFLSGPMEN